MTISTTRADLRAALALVTHAASSKSTIEILDGVLFAPTGTAMQLACSSLTVSASAQLACKHAGESFVVTAETFRRVVDSLPEGPIEISEKDGRITVAGGTSKVKLPVRDARDFPKIPSAPAAVARVRADALRRLLMAVRHATDTNVKLASPQKDGTHLRVAGGRIEATAADGNCLARAWDACEALGPLDVLAPSVGCAVILKALAELDDDALVDIAVGDARVFVGHVSAQVYSEPPLPADKLIERLTNAGEICVGREALISAVRRAAITSDEAKIQLVCRNGGELVVSAESAAGDSQTTLAGTVPDVERVLVAAHYLLPQLEQCVEDEVRIRLNALNGRGFLRFDSLNYLGACAPMLDVKSR